MSTDEVNEMYEANLDSSKTYNITLDITSGSADLDLFVYDPSTTIENRDGADTSSTSGGGGDDEEITGYSPPTSGYAGILVVHNGSGSDSASYTLTVSEENSPPNIPSTPDGPSTGTVDTSYSFSASTTDPDGDNVAYRFDWDDGSTSSWTSFVSSGSSANKSHSYSSADTYYVKAQAKDTYGATSGWSTSGHQIVISGGGGGGGGECEGITPMLVGKPYIVDNYDDCWPDCSPEESWNSFMTFINTIWASWGIGPVKYVDVDIKSKISYEECVSSVEGSIEHPDKHLEQTPMNPNPDPDYNYRGNYVYWAVFDEQVENWDKEEEIDDIITVLIEVATDKNLDKTAKILKMAKFLNKYFPNLPPALYLTNITTNDTSSKSHPDPVDPKIGVPTYLSDLADKILVFRSFSPVDIAVIDPDGKSVGIFHINSTVVEINDFGNNSFYTGNETESQIILLANPKFGNYTVEVAGVADGKYDLEVIKIVDDSVGEEEFMNIDILKDEKHVYQIIYGLETASLYSLIYGTQFTPGETVSSKIYVENSGGVDIDDELVFIIKDPTGKRIYKKRKPIYLERDEMMSFKFNWDIPSDATKGHYWLRVEFNDPDIDFIPLTKSFWVD